MWKWRFFEKLQRAQTIRKRKFFKDVKLSDNEKNKEILDKVCNFSDIEKRKKFGLKSVKFPDIYGKNM